MFLVKQLRLFYEDLNSPDYHSAIGIVHSRFSTNTNPSWQRSHPNRMMVHNGEINTITGNVDKMLSRESILKSDVLGDRMKDIVPMLDVKGSDSARLDNTLEFMMMSGMDLPLAVMANHSGTMAAYPDNESGKESLLSILCNHDGTVGRSCFHHFHGW